MKLASTLWGLSLEALQSAGCSKLSRWDAAWTQSLRQKALRLKRGWRPSFVHATDLSVVITLFGSGEATSRTEHGRKHWGQTRSANYAIYLKNLVS